MNPPAVVPMALGLGAPEILILILILILLFGAKKLPELARGSGRALRIFKAETKGLMDDEEEDSKYKSPEQRQIDARNRAEAARPLESPTDAPVEQPRADGDNGR